MRSDMQTVTLKEEILRLRNSEDLSIRNIAEAVGISSSAVHRVLRPPKRRLLKPRPCAYCSVKFIPKRRNTAVYCSNKCSKAHRPQRPKRERERPPTPKPCIGWVIRDGIIAICGEMFVRELDTATGHVKCLQRKTNLEKQQRTLGEAYTYRAIVKLKVQNYRCSGWVIRDHIVSVCGAPIVQKRRRASHILNSYHLPSCFWHKKQWQAVGYKLGDSVLRTCAYRKCNATFDRTKHSRSGDYYCPNTSHATLEKLARKADEWAAKLAKAEANLAESESKLGRGRTFEKDITQYGPRVTDLKTKKSWGQLTNIMNRETGKTNTQSYYRHIRDGYLSRAAMKAS
jgi:hypothetical protein